MGPFSIVSSPDLFDTVQLVPDPNLGRAILRVLRATPPPLEVETLAAWCGSTSGALRKRWRRLGLTAALGGPKTFLAAVACSDAHDRLQAGAHLILIGIELGCDERTVRRLLTRTSATAPTESAFPNHLGGYGNLSLATALGRALAPDGPAL
jgi:hypothetical protein